MCGYFISLWETEHFSSRFVKPVVILFCEQVFLLYHQNVLSHYTRESIFLQILCNQSKIIRNKYKKWLWQWIMLSYILKEDHAYRHIILSHTTPTTYPHFLFFLTIYSGMTFLRSTLAALLPGRCSFWNNLMSLPTFVENHVHGFSAVWLPAHTYLSYWSNTVVWLEGPW